MGLLSGWGIGVLAVKGLSTSDVIYGMRFYFRPWSLIFCGVKCGPFGVGINIVAGFIGLEGKGGAEGVGKTTTTAVVTTTLAIMVLDLLLAPILKAF
jgi:phospholipid/cholesterol/gamma-HCH transport system permease protein